MEYYFYNTSSRAHTVEPIPRFPVLIQQGFAASGGDWKYGEYLGQLEPGDILLMYENRVGIVAVGRVEAPWNEVAYTVPKYYMPAEMAGLDGDPQEYRIDVDWFHDLSSSPIGYKEVQTRFSTPRGTIKRIATRKEEAERLIEELQASLPPLPEEVNEPTLYVEGATRRLSVNAYERNREAVQRCKAIHGTACAVCGVDFAERYGAEFAGFIHVHHLRPLSEIDSEYMVDPETDLRPVCPNCHAVIHHGGKLRTIEEAQSLLGI